MEAWRKALDAIQLREFCQDPETGLLCGSEPSGGSSDSGGDKESGSGKPPGGGKPLPESDLKEVATKWVGSGWADYQHAARALIEELPADEYICYDCQGDDKERLATTRGLLASIEKNKIDKPLFRGLLVETDYKVGDTFSESLTSWTGKQELAVEFAEGHYAAPWDKGKKPTLVSLVTTENMRGIHVSSRLPADIEGPLKDADEWLTSGQYEVVEVKPGKINHVTVRRISPAKKKNLKLSYRPDGAKAMPMNPHKDESKEAFMDRCMHDMSKDPDRTNDANLAACIDIWDRNKSANGAVTKQPEPEPDEDYQDFMDRCMETDDEETCQLQWDNRAAENALTKRTTVIDRDGLTVQKTHAGHIDGTEYVLSDETVDRMGDVIQSDGWRLDAFKKNPIALFNHRADFIIGTWKNLRIEDGVLRGHLNLAPEGTSPRIDEIRKLVDAKILRATSVGFKPLKYEALNKDSVPPNPFGGLRFLEQELVETSLVSVPANPNALAIAKNLDISDTTLRLVFAGQGERTAASKIVRRSHGGQADKSQVRTKDKAMTLAQNIVEAQSQLTLLRDGLQQHLDTLDNDNVTDAQMTKTDEFHEKIARKRKQVDQLIESEKALGLATDRETERTEVHEIRMPKREVDKTIIRVPAEAGKSYQAGDHTWKALTCLVKMQGDRYRKASALDVIRDTVGENDKVRAVFDVLIGKAASVPALTSQTGWAAELVRTDIQGFMDSLQPASVATRLLAKGLQFNFGTNGIISIPTRSPTPTIAGSFVGEGAPIPVRQGAFTAITMVPKKLAVITVFSREISEHSDPAIEGLLRTAIVEDTAVAVDSVLLDANPATNVRPAGLRNGISTLTPTAGGGFAAVVGDIKQMVGALVTSTLGNLRNPVWLMSPMLELGLRLTVAPNTGVFPFAAEISGGTFAGFPVVVSPNVTADTLYLIDAADLVSASGEPRFDVSDSATVHMEDTTPLAISSSGTPNTVAAPVRSFWQTDTLGIRMIMPLNWAMRRTGMVAFISGTTWD